MIYSIKVSQPLIFQLIFQKILNGTYKVYIGTDQIGNDVTLSDYIVEKTITIASNLIEAGKNKLILNDQQIGNNIPIRDRVNIQIDNVTDPSTDKRLETVIPGIYNLSSDGIEIGNIIITDDKKITQIQDLNNEKINILYNDENGALSVGEEIIIPHRINIFGVNDQELFSEMYAFKNGKYPLYMDIDDGNGNIFIEDIHIRYQKSIIDNGLININSGLYKIYVSDEQNNNIEEFDIPIPFIKRLSLQDYGSINAGSYTISVGDKDDNNIDQYDIHLNHVKRLRTTRLWEYERRFIHSIS